ncbi:MAG: condensation domain-containing protein, partial [Burkholderiaceae bacterium]
LRAHADAQAAGSGLAALEAAAHAPSAELLLAGEPRNRAAVVAQCLLDSAATGALLDLAAKHLMAAPLDLLCAALAEAAQPVCLGKALLIEAVDTERRPPRGAPGTDGLAGNLECVLPVAASTSPMSIEARLRSVKSARQAVEPAGPAFRVLAHTFDLPAADIGVSWACAQFGSAWAMLHSPPTFGPSVRGILLADTDGGRLRLAWAGQEPVGGASDLLRRIAAVLEDLALSGGQAAGPLYTTADFPLAGLAESELQALLGDARDVQDIYPLSPMQEAMLVHTLAAGKSEINFEQSCMRIHGALDLDALTHAWQTVLDRHDVLRTAFHWRGLARPVQVVHRRVELPLKVHDWPHFDPARLDDFLAADRACGFELSLAPLLRLHAIRTADDELYLVSSFHHLLVDGWCLGRLEREVRAVYESARSGRPALLDQPAAYKSYIDWLSRHDGMASRRFFAGMLSDPPERRRLRAPARAAAGGYVTSKLALSRPATRALVAFTRRRGLTLAAAIHFAWAVWLASRLDSQDVIFGTTVSGRPVGVAGVESIVGLFINNLPLRLRLDEHATVGEGIAQLHGLLGELQEHAYLSPAEIAETADGSAGPLFDTLVVVENLASGTSAWAGAEGLTVEAVQSRMKTAYDLTFIAVPGDAMVLSLVQPVDDREPLDGQAALESLAAILSALPDAVDEPPAVLPRPAFLPYADAVPRPAAAGLRLSTRPRSTLEARIATIVADLAPGLSEADTAFGACGLDTDFWQLGLSSLELTQLAMRLSATLDRPVPIALLLEHRTIAALAAAVHEGRNWSPIVVMSDGRARDDKAEPFICVHPIAGDVSVFLDLARAMPPQLPFWALQAPGLEEGQEPLATVQALAESNLQALAKRGKPAPRWIGGYSFGGLVAFEMARQLAAQGRMPERVVILDTPAPLPRASILNADPDYAQAEWLLRMIDVRARFQGRPTPLDLEELLALPAERRFDLALARSHAAGLLPPAATAAWLRRAHHCSLVQYDAYLAYQPAASSCRDLPLALVRAAQPLASDLGEAENAQLALPAMGWQIYTDIDIAVQAIDGDHVSMLGSETAGKVARAIGEILRGDQPTERKARAAE